MNLIQESIKHWEANVEEAKKDEWGMLKWGSYHDIGCPLCKQYMKKDARRDEVKCTGCPIAEATGHDDGTCCDEWQHVNISQHLSVSKSERLHYVKRMLEFLRSL